MKKQGYEQGVICQIIGGSRKQEIRKQCNSIRDEVILTMQTKGKAVQFEGEDMKLGKEKSWAENSNHYGNK